MVTNNKIDFQEGFDVEETSPGRVKVNLDLTEVADQLGQAAHPNLAAHDVLGLATDAELVAHAASQHGTAHPDLFAHDSLGLATDAELATHAGDDDPHPGLQKESEKGAASGYASLDSGGKVPSSQIPAIAFGQVFEVASEAAMLALSAAVGDIAIRSDLSETFILAVLPASTLGNWHELLSPAGGVTAVNGRTGSVTGVQDSAEKGAASGYAALDGSGVVPDAQLPPGLARDAEVTSAIATHTTDAADSHDASSISLLDTAGNYAATDVEGALAEERAYADLQFMRRIPTGFPIQFVDKVWGSDLADGDSEGNAKLTVAAGLAGLSLNYGRLMLPAGQELEHTDTLIIPQNKEIYGYGPQGIAGGGSTLKSMVPDDGRPAIQWGSSAVGADVSHGVIMGVRFGSQANANGWGLDCRNLQNMTRLSRVFVSGFTKMGIKSRDVISNTDWVFPGFVGFDRVWVSGGTEVHFDIEAGYTVQEFRLCGSDPRTGCLKVFYVHNKHNISTGVDLATAAATIKFVSCKVESGVPVSSWTLEQNGEVDLDACYGGYESPTTQAAVTWHGPLVTSQGVVVTEPPVKMRNFITQGYAKGFASPDFPEEDIPVVNTAGTFSSVNYSGKDQAPSRWTGMHPAMTLDDALTIQPKAAGLKGLHVTPRSDQVANSAEFDGFLVNDAFARADSSTLIGGGWSAPLRGTWGIGSNQGRLVSVTDEALVTYPGLTADGALEVAVIASSVAARCFAGLCFRVNNSANYLRYTINGQLGELDLKMIATSVATTLKTANMTVVPGQTYILKVQLDGLTIRCYLDGVLMFTHVLTGGTQAGFLTQTLHGLHSNRSGVQDDGGSRWDNFKFSTAAFTIDPAGIPHWAASVNQQTTVGAAGAASALPATPTKYLKVVDSTGATLVLPAYAAT